MHARTQETMEGRFSTAYESHIRAWVQTAREYLQNGQNKTQSDWAVLATNRTADGKVTMMSQPHRFCGVIRSSVM